MANTAEGISVGDQQGLDPNDPADFEAIMAGRGVQKVEGEETIPDRSISSGLTTEAGPGRTPDRDPETGRFVSNQEKSAAAEDTSSQSATDTSGEEVTTGDFASDPEVEEFLQKYDGDLVKALKGAANVQSLIGRRDERAEKLELELAELRGRLDGVLAAGATNQAAPALSNEQVQEVVATRIESLGYEAAATEAANVAHNTGDERALEAVMEQWNIEAPFAAMNFLTDFRIWQREQSRGSQSEEIPAWQQRAEEQVKVDQYGEAFTTLRNELGAEAFEVVASRLNEALDQMPKNVLAMIDSDDHEARDAGFRIVADRALRLAAAAPAAVVGNDTDAAIQRKLTGARVASGALRPVPKAPEAPTNKEDAIKEFKRQIVEAPTTNISSGLTYGPTP